MVLKIVGSEATCSSRSDVIRAIRRSEIPILHLACWRRTNQTHEISATRESVEQREMHKYFFLKLSKYEIILDILAWQVDNKSVLKASRLWNYKPDETDLRSRDVNDAS